ncbi:MAG: DUF805 domain-containing protein [Brevundimonas sp.]|jgi:uncharacterized membrane protein YhaH (DUF805 family)
MNIQTSVKTCLGKYVDFKGRAGRSEFWWYVVASIVAATVASILDSMFGKGLFSAVVILGNFLPYLAVQVRRLHDTGRSGWWLLIALVPVLGMILLLFWWSKKGTPAANAHGEPIAEV